MAQVAGRPGKKDACSTVSSRVVDTSVETVIVETTVEMNYLPHVGMISPARIISVAEGVISLLRSLVVDCPREHIGGHN